jgi:hypothetical protein
MVDKIRLVAKQIATLPMPAGALRRLCPALFIPLSTLTGLNDDKNKAG